MFYGCSSVGEVGGSVTDRTARDRDRTAFFIRDFAAHLHSRDRAAQLGTVTAQPKVRDVGVRHLAAVRDSAAVLALA